MKNVLYYLPLEPYVERYTWFMSAVDGWAERNFKKFDVNFVRVEGEQLGVSIKAGKVLDACGRSHYALTQTANLVKLINEGAVKDGDVVYVEDFWHPGIESLFYIRHLTGIQFKIGTFLHAQSVDDSDFTYDMKEWIRPLEIGYGKGYDYIFVTSEILKGLCIEGGIGTKEKIFNVGLPYNSERLKEQLEEAGFMFSQESGNYVLFSSRFDDEKDPMFFLDLVEQCKDIPFVLVQPRKVLTSNTEVMARLEKIVSTQDNLTLVDTSNKLAYYELLNKAAVQFNCAIQDWVSWTLLEATTFGCLPLYPQWKDFPVELRNDERYLYKRKDLKDCEEKLRNLLKLNSEEKKSSNLDLQYIVKKHDNSWKNYLESMGLIKNV